MARKKVGGSRVGRIAGKSVLIFGVERVSKLYRLFQAALQFHKRQQVRLTEKKKTNKNCMAREKSFDILFFVSFHYDR